MLKLTLMNFYFIDALRNLKKTEFWYRILYYSVSFEDETSTQEIKIVELRLFSSFTN